MNKTKKDVEEVEGRVQCSTIHFELSYRFIVDDVSDDIIEEERVVWYDKTCDLHLGLQVVCQPGNGCMIQVIGWLCMCVREEKSRVKSIKSEKEGEKQTEGETEQPYFPSHKL